jgi:hypothetical protein
MRIADRNFEERIQTTITTKALTNTQETPVLIIPDTGAVPSATE